MKTFPKIILKEGPTKFKVGDRVRYKPDKVMAGADHQALIEYEVIEAGFSEDGYDCVYLLDEWDNVSPCIMASVLWKIEVPS